MSNLESKQYLTVKQLSEKYPAFPASGIRHLIFHAKAKNFENCLIRVGRKVLVDSDRFSAWIESHRNATHQGA